MGLGFQYPPGATPIDPDEASGLIPPLATQSELNAFEAANILQADIWSRSSGIVRDKLLDQATLREIHKRMFGETWRWAGRYRLTQKSIGVEAWRISTEMSQLTSDMVEQIRTAAFSPKEIVARFHHRLVWIHPFPNGNGRFARLAADRLAQQLGVDQPTWGGNDLVKSGLVRDRYIEALRSADSRDIAPLLAFMWA